MVVQQLVRNLSVAMLQEYFKDKDILLSVDWSQSRAYINRLLVCKINALPPVEQTQIRIDAERIVQMSDDVGQAALMNVASCSELKKVSSPHECSCWIYLHTPDKFRQAEDIRYVDHYRQGRDWSGYQVQQGYPLNMQPAALEEFKQLLRNQLSINGRLKVDWFARDCQDAEDKTQVVMQVMIYQEALPNNYLIFESDDDVVTQARCPVNEYAILYCETTGVLEVIATKSECRHWLAKAFAAALLATDKTQPLSLWQFDLTPLLSPSALLYDAQDGIEAVHVVMLKFKQPDTHARLQLEIPTKSPFLLHDWIQSYLGANNFLQWEMFSLVQAKLVIRFTRGFGRRQRKRLSVKITAPNSCDLRNRTEHEQMIGKKYLKRWGLLQEV